jgi:chromosomal replication initiation ATPase DnaA
MRGPQPDRFVHRARVSRLRPDRVICYGSRMSAFGPRDQLKLPLSRDVPAGAAEFVRSGSNAGAVEILERWPDGGDPVLAICGPAGCGKSHLAGIWAERVGAIALHGAEAGLADPLELEGRPVLLDRAQDADDVTLFHLINLAQSGGGALLLASRPAPRAWTTTLPDLRSRLDVIRTVTLQEPDDAVLAAILRARFAARSITPGDDLIDYLVRRIDRSATAVESVVERLDAEHRPVTRTLARQVLEARDATGELFD